MADMWHGTGDIYEQYRRLNCASADRTRKRIAAVDRRTGWAYAMEFASEFGNAAARAELRAGLARLVRLAARCDREARRYIHAYHMNGGEVGRFFWCAICDPCAHST